MKYSTAQIVWHYIELGKNFEFILFFLISLMLITACFMAYRLFKLRFFLVICIAEAISVINWFWLYNFEFGGFEHLALYFPQYDMFLMRVIQDVITFTLHVTPTILYAIGTVMALRFLFKKRKAIKNSQQGGPGYPAQSAGSPDP